MVSVKVDGKISAELVQGMGDDLTVVNAARVSFGTESQAFNLKDAKLIHYLADHKHFSPFEHCVATFIIECPLYIRSQIHRHRTFSYNEVSRRYTSEDALTFHLPEYWRLQHSSSKQCSSGLVLEDVSQNTEIDQKVISLLSEAGQLYTRMLELGVARELARAILPQCMMTRFYMTGNLRNWAHFLALRLDSHSQEEVRIIAEQVKSALHSLFPVSLEALVGVTQLERKED